MSIILTDAQIARLFDLCAQIAAIRGEMPAPPKGFAHNQTVTIELAKNLRETLEKHNDALVELGALLR